jgi:hypothetical protein
MNKELYDKVFYRDCGRCVLTGKQPVHLHHIDAKGVGGKDDEKNLVCLHWKVHLGDLETWRRNKIQKYLKEYIFYMYGYTEKRPEKPFLSKAQPNLL